MTGLLRATVVTREWNGHRVRISTQSELWRGEFFHRSCLVSNSQRFDHESGPLRTSYPYYPPENLKWCHALVEVLPVFPWLLACMSSAVGFLLAWIPPLRLFFAWSKVLKPKNPGYLKEDVLLGEFIYLVFFLAYQVTITVGDSGLFRCVPCFACDVCAALLLPFACWT